MKNSLIDWINKDKKLQTLLSEIEATGKANSEQAKMAFDKLANLYRLPKMPNDVSESEEKEGKVSLFEEHALIKFMEEGKDVDPRGIVLSATFNLVNGFRVDIKEVIKKEFGNNPPNSCKIGIRGSGFDGEVVFPQKEEKTWIELGCKIMKQPI